MQSSFEPTRRLILCVVVACSLVVSSLRAEDSAEARQQYLDWIGRARSARAIEFRCAITSKRADSGVVRLIESTLEVSIGRDGERLFGRFVRRVPQAQGTDSGDDGSIVVLADGDYAFSLDESRQSFVRMWPPRFVAAGEGRSFSLFRAFLGDAIEEPVRVTRTIGKHPDETVLEVEFRDRFESMHLDAEGHLVSVSKNERGVNSGKTKFQFDRFELIEGANPYDYSCRPLGSYRDATATTASKLPITVRSAPSDGLPSPGRRALKEGDRDVDAAFLTADNAVVRLLNMRGRKIVIVFLDPLSPNVAKDRLVLERTSRLASRGSVPPLFLVVEARTSKSAPRVAVDGTPTLQTVSPARGELEAIFGVLLPPTTIVLDETGTVIQRSAVLLDENRLRQVLGID